MRKLFIVLSKVLGVFFIYIAILSIPGVIVISTFQSHGESFYRPASGLLGLGLAKAWLSLVLSFVFALFLLFKTEVVADYLNIKDDDSEFSHPDAVELLDIGLVLVAVFILVTAFPNLVRVIYRSVKTEYAVVGGYSAGSIIAYVLQVAMALHLLLDHRRTTERLFGGSSKFNQDAP